MAPANTALHVEARTLLLQGDNPPVVAAGGAYVQVRALRKGGIYGVCDFCVVDGDTARPARSRFDGALRAEP